MTDNIGYGALIEEAMLNVVKGALQQVQKQGITGEHHFYITFLTTESGVDIPQSLLKDHPQAMTIVLQNQFWNLIVEKDLFKVDLSFNKMQQTLTIPFESILSFDDPSVQFSLHFNSSSPTDDDEEDREEVVPKWVSANKKLSNSDKNTNVKYDQNNVVSLADFKKNKSTDTDKD